MNKRGAYDPKPRLYVDKVYTLKDYHVVGFTRYDIYIEEHPEFTYSEDCFITNTEYRKRKLNNIKKIV